MHSFVSIIMESLTLKLILGLVWTALSFFCGAYVGHKFNLYRDKRKEFNQAADDVYQKAITERKLLVDDCPTRYETIKEHDVLMLVRIASKRRKRHIWSAWQKHLAAKDKYTPGYIGRFNDELERPYDLSPIIKTIDQFIMAIERQ
ncbi:MULTISPECIES: hypothetical protein [Providencia]|uniref:Uncharacterized protein n=1 Tax=Providencia stuartii TaxID=588 RepID=A0AAI9DC08_PROST|nr:hypothetical protein [Providencia sp. PROV254]ELR5113011.1 hypothetical protein [Providencia stuartii]WIE07329.1 hypothetical protein N4838_015780 [Providencia rettgeri]